MGTALTEDQVGPARPRWRRCSCSRSTPTGAGQGAMLKAAEVARSRKLELRVVALPAGRRPGRPARARGGRGAALAGRPLGARSSSSGRARSSPTADVGTRRGPRPALERPAPGLPPARPAVHARGARAADRRPPRALARRWPRSLDRPARRRERRAARPPRPRRRRPAPVAAARPGRADFLGLVVALPARGPRARSAALDPARHFSGELTRRAATHLGDAPRGPARHGAPRRTPSSAPSSPRLAAHVTPAADPRRSTSSTPSCSSSARGSTAPSPRAAAAALARPATLARRGPR